MGRMSAEGLVGNEGKVPGGSNTPCLNSLTEAPA